MRSLELLPLEHRSSVSPTHLKFVVLPTHGNAPALARIRLSGQEHFAHEVVLNIVDNDQDIAIARTPAVTPGGRFSSNGSTLA